MKQCNAPNCNKKTIAKGFCPTHYARLRRTGTTDKSRKHKPLGKGMGIHIQVSEEEYKAIKAFKEKHGVTGRDLLITAIRGKNHATLALDATAKP